MTTQTNCRRCRGLLSDPASVARKLGPACARARRAEAVAGYKPEQVEKARELLELGGVVRMRKPGLFKTVSSDGTWAYLVYKGRCNCPSGLRYRRCYHPLAVALELAA